MRVLMLSAAICCGLGQGVAAQPPLGEVQQIHEGYFRLWMANKIRKECPTISPRLIVAQSAISDLKRRARDMGYSDQQIDAYIDSDAEKDRFGKRRTALFMKRGHKRNEDGYCAFGREEIARNSAIGVYLHARN